MSIASVARVVRTRCHVSFACVARCPRAKSFVSARCAHRVCMSCVVNSPRLEPLVLIILVICLIAASVVDLIKTT